MEIADMETCPWAKCMLGCDLHDGDVQIFPCLHVLCSADCLQKIAEAENDKSSQLECRTCKQIFSRDQIGMKIKLNDFFEKKAQLEDVVLECELCIDLPVVSFCIDCDANLCSACALRHCRLRGKTDHQLDENLEGRRQIGLELLNKTRNQCVSHGNQETHFYCHNCQLKVCGDCRPAHNDHLVVTIKDEMTAISSQMNVTKEIQQEIENTIAELEQNMKSFESKKWDEFISALDSFMLGIQLMLNRRRQALHDQGKELHLKRVKDLKDKIAFLKLAKNNSSHLIRLHGFSENLKLDVKGTLNLARMTAPLSDDLSRVKENMDKGHFSELLTKDQIVVLPTETLAQLERLISCVGSVELGNLLPRSLPVPGPSSSSHEMNQDDILNQITSSKGSSLKYATGVTQIRRIAVKSTGGKAFNSRPPRLTHPNAQPIATTSKNDQEPQTVPPLKISLTAHKNSVPSPHAEKPSKSISKSGKPSNRKSLRRKRNSQKQTPASAFSNTSKKRSCPNGTQQESVASENNRDLLHENETLKNQESNSSQEKVVIASDTITQPELPITSETMNDNDDGNDSVDTELEGLPINMDVEPVSSSNTPEHASELSLPVTESRSTTKNEEVSSSTGISARLRQRSDRRPGRYKECIDPEQIQFSDDACTQNDEPKPSSSKRKFSRSKYPKEGSGSEKNRVNCETALPAFLDAPINSVESTQEASDGLSDLDKDDYCGSGVCINDGTENSETLVRCVYCPKSFHLQCHIPVLKHVPEGMWRCNYDKTIQILEQELQSMPDLPSSEEKPLTDANPRQFAKSCKFMMEVHKIPEIQSVKWSEPLTLKSLRMKLCLPLEQGQKPFSNVKEFMQDFKTIFLQAFKGLQKMSDSRLLAKKCFKQLLTLVKEYYPEHQNIFEDLLQR